ncbi:Gypsy retrotransposon integrase-like protein 1 [Oopsacas minuta]|uniref:Gypsy retrotransposon integrase-like protein 1 n=1 Tax=Oopsacas minuta TaxID=111878 RepID=A0AAV7KLG0_9METZ|nr:Gypsy retrotransposon integrase-like protein 1 [Oopsacas minuta]
MLCPRPVTTKLTESYIKKVAPNYVICTLPPTDKWIRRINNKSAQQSLMKILLNHMEIWPEHLEAVRFSINNRVSEATKYSGFELMSGRRARLPIEVESRGKADNVDVFSTVYWDCELEVLMENAKIIIDSIYPEAKENFTSAQMKMKRSYDQKL